MLAVYWSRWGFWTLVDLNHLPPSGALSLTNALKWSEMSILGDRMVGTVPPFSLRFHADRTKPRRIQQDGQTEFTIGGIDLLAGGNVVEDPVERKLFSFFFFFGRWQQVEQPAAVTGDSLDYFDICANPPEAAESSGGFCNLGFLSQMISRQYIQKTSSGMDVKTLIPQEEPEALGVLLPRDYAGKALKLWILKFTPNLKDVEKPT